MENNRIASPINDFPFKLLFFNEETKYDLLKKLLVDCIEFDDKQVSEITLIDRTDDKKHEDDKLVIFDVNAKLSDGTYVNIEVQKHKHAGYAERSVFYTCKRLIYQARKSMEYKDLKQTISLNILGFDYFKDDDSYYRRFYLVDDVNNVRLTDVIRIDYMELSKIKSDHIDNNDKKALWGMFFNAKTVEELDMVKNIDKTFEEAVERLKNISTIPGMWSYEDEQIKREADRKAILDYAREEGLQEGKQEGRQVGLQEGIERGVQNVAKTMLEAGYSVEEIAKITGLSLGEIENLK